MAQFSRDIRPGMAVWSRDEFNKDNNGYNLIESVDLVNKKLVVVRTLYGGVDDSEFIYDFSQFVEEVNSESSFITYFYRSWITTDDSSFQYFAEEKQGFEDVGKFRLKAEHTTPGSIQTLEIQLA